MLIIFLLEYKKVEKSDRMEMCTGNYMDNIKSCILQFRNV